MRLGVAMKLSSGQWDVKKQVMRDFWEGWLKVSWELGCIPFSPFTALSILQRMPGKSHRQRSLAGYSSWGNKRIGHELVTKQQQQIRISHVSGTVLSILHTFIHLVLETILWGWCIILFSPFYSWRNLKEVEQHAQLYNQLVAELRFKLKWSYTTACTLKPKALLLGVARCALSSQWHLQHWGLPPKTPECLVLREHSPCTGFSLNSYNSLMRPGLLFGSSRWGKIGFGTYLVPNRQRSNSRLYIVTLLI